MTSQATLPPGHWAALLLLTLTLAAGTATALIVAVGDGHVITTSPTGSAWTPRPVTTSLPLNAVATDGSDWVAVGSYGTILTSPDGITWTQRASGTTNTLRGVATDGTNWVAVGDAGTILQSSNPTTSWTTQSLATVTNPLNSVATTGSVWVIVGDRTSGNAPILVSTGPPGWTWTSQSSGTTNHLKAVARDATSFVAVGTAGTIVVSPATGPSAGISWTPQCPNPPGTATGCQSADLKAIARDATQWVAVGAAGTVLTSPDALAWAGRCTAPPASGSGCVNTALNAVAAGGGLWLAVGDAGTILASNDAVTWSPRTSGTPNRATAVAGDGTAWAVLADFGMVLTSSDTTTWTRRNPNTTTWPYDLRDVASDGVRFVAVGTGPAVGDGAYPAIVTSTDATNWVSQWSGPTVNRDLRTVAGGGNRWITNAPHRIDAMATTDGGVTWVHQSPTGTCSPTCGFAVETNGTHWVMAGGAPGQATSFRVSSDGGNTWVSYSGPATPWGVRLKALATDGSLWVAVGESGTIMTSPDAITWTPQTSNTGAHLNGIARAGTTWVAVGDGGTILSGNADATSWTVQASGGSDWNAVAVATSGNPWVVVGDGGLVRTSANGLAWGAPTSAGTSNDLRGVTIEPGPPSCAASPAVVLVGSLVTFTGQGGTPTYTWASPGSNAPANGTGNTYARSYATAGTKTVTVTDRFGQSNTCTVGVVDFLSCPDTMAVAGIATTVTASGGQSPYAWSTSGSNNNGPVTANPWSGTFALPGTYTMTVANASPNQTDTCTVTVVAALACTATPSAVLIGAPAQLAASGPPGPFTWTSTDGEPAAGAGTLNVTYPTAGLKTATVTSSNPDQSRTCTVSVVAPLGCSPATVHVVGSAAASLSAVGGVAPHDWSALGATPATGAGWTYAPSYASPGTYTVYLNSTGPPSQAATCTVNVLPPLQCNATPPSATTGDTVAFSRSGGQGPYTWSAPAGSPNAGLGPSWASQFDVAGAHPVTVQDSGPIQQTAACPVTVMDPPLVCTLGTLSGPPGTLVRLTANGGTGAYSWSTPSGNPSFGTTRWFNTTYANPGNYQVQVTSGSQTASCTILVDVPPPPPSLHYPGSPGTYLARGRSPPTASFTTHRIHPCDDWTVHLDAFAAVDADGVIAAWSWSLGDGSTATGVSLTHTYPGAGAYPLTLTVRDDEGLIATRGLDIILGACQPLLINAPKATMQAGKLSVACFQATGGYGTYKYEATNLPEGATFDPLRGCLSWTPAEEQAGIDCVRIRATDGAQSATECWPLSVVTPATSQPQITLKPQEPTDAAEPPVIEKSIVHASPSQDPPPVPTVEYSLGLPVAILGLSILMALIGSIAWHRGRKKAA